MKTKRLLWIVSGLALVGVICITVVGSWIVKNSTIVVVNQWSCPVANSSVSSYKFAASDGDITDISCNTADVQQASATLSTGTVYPFYIEYDGQYASWDIPDGFTCTASWTDGKFTSAGNQAIAGTSAISLNCSDQNGHALYMKSKLAPVYPQG